MYYENLRRLTPLTPFRICDEIYCLNRTLVVEGLMQRRPIDCMWFPFTYNLKPMGLIYYSATVFDKWAQPCPKSSTYA